MAFWALSKTPDRVDIKVYTGIRNGLATKAQVVARWLTLPPDWLTTKDTTVLKEGITEGHKADLYGAEPYKRKDTTHDLIVGMIYEVPMSGESTAWFGRIKPLGMWPDHDQVVKWKAQDRATFQVLEAERADKTLKDKRVDLEVLAPLRAAYERLGSRERAALITRVTVYLVTGR